MAPYNGFRTAQLNRERAKKKDKKLRRRYVNGILEENNIEKKIEKKQIYGSDKVRYYKFNRGKDHYNFNKWASNKCECNWEQYKSRHGLNKKYNRLKKRREERKKCKQEYLFKVI